MNEYFTKLEVQYVLVSDGKEDFVHKRTYRKCTRCDCGHDELIESEILTMEEYQKIKDKK